MIGASAGSSIAMLAVLVAPCAVACFALVLLAAKRKR